MLKSRRSKRKPQRSPEMKPDNQDRDRNSQNSFMRLPEEILRLVTQDIAIQDKAKFALTNKAMKAYIEPQLYQKIYTRIGTPQDTAGLVALLTKRPEIVPMIKVLVLDEYHPQHTRRLLSIKMSSLWCLLIQHAGQAVQDVTEREKRALNRNLEDAALFRQPAVERFRLSYVDYTAFESVNKTYFAHPGLKKLWTEDTNHSSESLLRLVKPSKSLTEATFHHWGDPPFQPRHYLSALLGAAETLKILRLEWRHTRSNHVPGYDGLDLTSFTALRLLRIQPGTLLGPGGEGVESYTTPDHPDLAELVRSRLPPRLKVLLLESITVPPPAPGLAQLLFPMDIELITCLIKQRRYVAPKLKSIFMYYLDEMTDPTELNDIIDPPNSYLDED
ncbi:MAG: hypothetical protein Q9210_002757 [Variospora velana]